MACDCSFGNPADTDVLEDSINNSADISCDMDNKINKQKENRRMRKIITAICKNENCKKKFKKWDSKRKVARGSKTGVRGANAITCCPKCSKEYSWKEQERRAGVKFKKCVMCGKETKEKKLDEFGLCPDCQESDLI